MIFFVGLALGFLSEVAILLKHKRGRPMIFLIQHRIY